MPKIYYMKYDGVSTRCLYDNGVWTDYKCSPKQIISDMCIQCGCTLEGRVKAYRELTGNVQKAPVLISERARLIYFPTAGMNSRDCQWFCFDDILDVKEINSYSTFIKFVNGADVTVSINVRLIRKQMSRCREFNRLLNTGCKVFEKMGTSSVGFKVLNSIKGK